MMKRRTFIKRVGLDGTAAAIGIGTRATHVWAKGASIRWRMATSWPKGFPILQTGARRFASLVETMSDGRMKIDVYAAREKVDPLKVHEAVSRNIVECGSTTAFYWAQKIPALQWFTSVPFGLKAQDMNTWYYEAGGRELWEEVYADYDLLPMLGANTGVQMGGWFNREIRKPSDFSGLRVRIPGLGGKVVARLDAKVVLLPAGDIVRALEKNEIDAAEWVGPYHDTLMGFPKVAKYYYAPGWQEPGSIVELIVNRSAFLKLPSSLQHIVRTAAAEVNHLSFCAFEYRNKEAMHRITAEKKVQLRLFSHQVLRVLEKLSNEVIEEEAKKDPMALKVHQAYNRFQNEMRKFSLLRGADIRI